MITIMTLDNAGDNSVENDNRLSSLRYYSISVLIAVAVIVSVLAILFYFCPPDQIWDFVKPQPHKHSIDDNLINYHALNCRMYFCT